MKSRFYTFSFGYFVLLVVIIGLSLYATFDYLRLGKTAKTLLAHNSANVKAATNMLKSVGEQESAQVLLLNHYDDRVVESYKLCRDQFLNYYQIANRSCAMPRECGILDTIMTTYRMYLSLSETFIQASRMKQPRKQTAFMDMLATEEQLRALCLHLLDYNQTRIEETNLRIRKTANRGALLAVLSATALASVLIIGLNVQLRRDVIRPTQRLGQTLRLIRSGNLAPKIDISGGGELADLYAEFNKMTERLRAYERLNIQQIIAEKRKAEAVVESLDEPVIVTNSRGVLILMNHAAVRLLRIGNTDWQGKSVKTVVRNKKLRTLLSAITSAESAQTDFWIPIERDGGIQYFRPHRTTAAEDNGRIRYHVTWFQDVTAYRKLDQMKSDFIATVSHEFRTPLTSIHMSIDILNKEVLGQINAKQKELLDSAKEDARRLSKLVKDLLDLSKLESGRYRPKREWVDLHSLTQETLRSLDLVLKEKRIDLCFDASAGLPLVWGDSQQLSWAMTNLISNAIRHTPEHGTVTIDMKKVRDAVQVTVSDTGRGIPDKDIGVIFEKFVQIKEPTESTPGSVGLGLSITKEAIEAHGGTIGVTSKIGKGSTFFFELPLRKSETA